MKTTLIILIAGLIFLVTPMLATADDGRRHDGIQNHYKGWVKNDRYDHRYDYNRHDQQRNHRYDNRRAPRYNHKRDLRAKKQLRRELRETRQELRQVKRQPRHNQRRPYYARPHHLNPAVLIGLPHVVFKFGW